MAVTIDGKLRARTRVVLDDAQNWRFVEARWGSVSAAVRALGAALQSGDIKAIEEAVHHLELAGPVRATSFGDTPTVPAPEPVLDEINELIHTIDDRASAQE